VEAEHLELWPPNYPPEVNVVFPLDGAVDIPISTSELSFYIDDYENELMSYSVITSPDVGTGNGNLKPDGTYSVPISGLEGTETYSWTVQVSDGPNTVEETYSFSTEAVAPIVETPTPEDSERYVPVDIPQIQVHIRDLQGDLMDYTIETFPDIGSGGGSGVGNGFVSIPVGGLDFTTEYTWYVNVTDGVYWKHKIYSFQTEPIMVFNPFDEGWQYRKNITIDHSQVVGDLEYFPVMISLTDTDLRDKAQADGDDILFMDGVGVATRLYHEIEFFDDDDGELIAWVNANELSSTIDTTIVMYYGNSDCDDQQTFEKVWDDNFKAVYHLSETEVGDQRLDSTINSNHATPSNYNGDEAVIGAIDGADEFLADDRLDANSFILDSYDTVTISSWFITYDSVNDNVITSPWEVDASHSVGTLVLEDKFGMGIDIAGGGNVQKIKSNIICADGNWHYGVGTFNIDTNTVELYVDGTLDKTDTSVTNNPYPTHNFHFGNNLHETKSFAGIIDEIRFSNIIRSYDWISTEYNNQYQPSTFYIVGPEETGP
jgi:hypothetical protein